jgi:transposase
MDKLTILKLKREGHSNRKVAKLTGMDRKTVARYWNEYKKLNEELKDGGDIQAIQDAITSKPKYNANRRKPRKYNEAIDMLVDEILANEETKSVELGLGHKQKLTSVQIHEIVRSAGHDIGLTVLSNYVSEKRAIAKEVFIKQEYEYGDRLEYDFGEVRLIIGDGGRQTFYLAVISSPASGYRWACLYHTQKKEAFMDSHVKFFEKVGGVYRELVYDNMRNVVSKFIGRNEKQLNNDLVKMAMYYGFTINVTNCFSGNEKGHVESSVKAVRNKAFATRYKFDTIEDATAHLENILDQMNKNTMIEEEMKHLNPYMPPLELAQATEQQVDKYSFVRVENNFYSVPEHLVGRTVLVKNYLSEIMVYSSGNKVCSHKKKTGFHEVSVDINHYLNTFMRKPGALRNSAALKSNESLKALYDIYYAENPKGFVSLLQENKGKELPELLAAIEAAAKNPFTATNNENIEDNVIAMSKRQISELSRLFMCEGGNAYIN